MVCEIAHPGRGQNGSGQNGKRPNDETALSGGPGTWSEGHVRGLVSRFSRLRRRRKIERIVLPKGCEFAAYFIVGVAPPDPSERVNVYLPKSLIAKVDKRAAELGMSRSSFFGFAATTALSPFPGQYGVRAHLAEPRSKARKSGGLRTKASRTRKPTR
jgi:hypothetical protein